MKKKENKNLTSFVDHLDMQYGKLETKIGFIMIIWKIMQTRLLQRGLKE